MTKLPAVAAFFAAAVLSGCQPAYVYSIEEPYWTGDYSYSGSWVEEVPSEDVYVDDSYVDTGYYTDDSYIIDDGAVYEDSTSYDDSLIEEYYPQEEYYPYYQSSDSSYYPPSYSSGSSTYSSPWYYKPPTVSYPSPSWQNRFIGRRQPSTMYYYPDDSTNWQQTYPYYY